MDSEFVNFNGNLVEREKLIFNSENRGFRYGDSVFETMHIATPHIHFFDQHTERLFEAMDLIKIRKSEAFTKDYIYFQVQKLLKRNRHFTAARLRLTVFRNGGGNYKPADNAFSFLIESKPLETRYYKLNPFGINLGICDTIFKPVYPLGQYKTGNSLIYVIASEFCNSNKLDDALILNSSGYVVEATSSNVFVVKEGVIYTPGLADGCVAGIMRSQVIETAIKSGFVVYDECSVHPAELEQADEIFLTNAVNGIVWVSAFYTRRYFNKVARLLLEVINKNILV